MTAPPIEITSSGFLYAHQQETSQGTVLSVYRSTIVRDSDTVYRPVLDIVGESQPFARTQVEDDAMMGRSAEQLMYAVPKRDESR